jgi:exosortase
MELAAGPSAAGALRRHTITGLCGLIAVAAHAPLVAAHLQNLWSRPHFQFVGLLLPLVAWLIWQRWPRDEAYVPARRLEAVLLSGSVLALGGGLWLNSPCLGAISAILMTGLVIVHLAGVRSLARLLGPWLLLWIAVPPPLGFDLLLISQMQAQTSQLSSLLLDALRVDHLMAGNVLHVRGVTYFVDEACSGVHSLFALLGFTGLFAVFTRRRMLSAGLLLVGCIGWAMMANILRVGMIAIAHARWGVDLSSGWPHESLGLATFGIALGLTLSTDRWLHFVGHIARCTQEEAVSLWELRPGRERTATGDVLAEHQARLQAHQSKCSLARRSWRLRLLAVAAYSLLIAADVSGLTPEGRRAWVHNPLTAIVQEVMPAGLGRLTLAQFERIERDMTGDMGQHSCVWTYTGPEVETVRVSIDAPFAGWHELSRCYQGQGWTLEGRQVLEEAGLSWVEARFSKATGEHACLAFCLMDLDGVPLTPTANQGASRLVDRFGAAQSLQVQAFAQAGGPIDAPLRAEVRALFHALMQRCGKTAPGTRTRTQPRRGTDG